MKLLLPKAWRLAAFCLSFTACGAASELIDPNAAVASHDSGSIATFAGTGVAGIGPDGALRTQAPLNLPTGITWGPDGVAYIADWNNNRIVAVTARGTVVTVAGNGMLGDGPDGPALDSALSRPVDVAFDPQGRMVIAAWSDNQIKRVDLTRGLLTTVYGTGTAGFAGDEGPAAAAQFNFANGQAIRPTARMSLDSAGNLYIADTGNHRVRMVDTQGIIHTVAGDGTVGHAGDGGPATPAELNLPTDVAVAPDGAFYIVDFSNSCVRRVAPDRTISTAAGVCGTSGYAGDGGPATAALLKNPNGVALDPTGNLYIADTGNSCIRVVYR